MPDLGTMSAGAAYALLGALVFAESGILLGFFLPGDTVLFAAGLLSAARLSLPVLLVVVLVAAVTGDAVGYATGRAGGPAVLARARPALVARTRRFYDRYGAFAVVAARWVPWVRVLTPVLAGVVRMPYGRFLLANAVGAVTWGAGLLVLGHLAASAPGLRTGATYAGVGVAVVSLAGAVVSAVRSRR